MSTQAKLTLLLVSVFGVLLLIIGSFQFLRHRELAIFARAFEENNRKAIETLLQFKAESYLKPTKDNAIWDEMAEFCVQPDSSWAADNLGTSINTFNMSYMGVFSMGGKPIYEDFEDFSPPLPWNSTQLKEAFTRQKTIHAFEFQGNQLIEIFASAIVPSFDIGYTTPSRGYLISARVWDSSYCANLELISGFNLKILRDSLRPNPEDNGEHIFQSLPGINGKTNGWVKFSRNPPHQSQLKSMEFLLAIGLVVILAFILLFYFLSRKWLSQPLRILFQGLRTVEDPDLRTLGKTRGEFGELASLILSFQSQSEALKKEIIEKTEANAKNQLLFDLVPDAIFHGDFSGKLLTTNQQACRLTQYSREELLKIELHQLFYPGELERVPIRWEELKGGHTIVVERIIQKKNGESLPVEMTSRILPNGTFLSVFRDLSRQKQAEKSASRQLAQEVLLHRVTNQAYQEAIPLQALTELVCREASRILGVERTSVWLFEEGNLVCQTLYISSTNSFQAGQVLKEDAFRNEFEALKNARFVAAHDALNDPRTRGYVDVYLKPLGISSLLDAAIQKAGVIMGVLCIEATGPGREWEPDEASFVCQLADQLASFLLNADRQDAIRAMEVSRQMMSTAFEQSPLGILIAEGPDLQIVFANKAAFALSTNPAAAINDAKKTDLSLWPLALPNGQVISPEQHPLALSIRTGQTITGQEYLLHHPGKSQQWLVTNSAPIQGLQLEIQAGIMVFADISEAKMAEQELRKAKEKAEESDRLKSSFLANMSHEIRTPMNAILGFSNMLSGDDFSQEEKESFILTIQAKCQELLVLINDILDISRIECNLLEIHRKFFNPGQMLLQLETQFRNELARQGKHGIQLIPDLKKPYPQNLYSDPKRVTQILGNLLSNAIKFTDTGYIRFGLQQNNGGLQFFVEDTGRGIPKNKQGIIFDRFRQADESMNRIHSGSGLGLAICTGLAQLLGGRISLDSEPGRGSIFYFDLPIEDQTFTSDMNSSTEPEIPITDLRNHTILVAEDVLDNYVLIKMMLRKANPTLLHVTDGAQAIKAYEANPDIDLILMDIRMPVLDGYEASRRIRAQNRSIPIIALTAHAFEEERQKCIEAGCSDYISKPINRDSLLAIISHYLL